MDTAWVERYACGLQEACEAFGVTLIGGDTTSSPNTRFVNVTMGGTLLKNAIHRSDAKPTDDLWVTGVPGLAASGYMYATPSPAALEALRRPRPPLGFALALSEGNWVHGMMDLSDGLASDLPRLCKAAGVGAVVFPDAMPRHPDLNESPLCEALKFAGGDDFELLFTAPASAREAIQRLAEHHQVLANRIGHITSAVTVKLADRDWPRSPWTHFSNTDTLH